jgi:tetratricopeptide (TPR) repeat protein
LLAALGSFAVARAQQPPTNSAAANAAPATNSSAVTSSPTSPAAETTKQKLQDASKLSDQKQYEAALEKLDSVLLADPKNLAAYSLRGYIYSQQKNWDKSQKDFEAILQIDPKAATAKFDLSELKFMQKFYDGARVGFVALVKDPDVGDLAAYKIFLCDMLAGHTHVAAAELKVFDDAASHPSYYFGNAAWELYNKRPEDARHWLQSASEIYYPYKVVEYAATLEELGYLPLPPPPLAPDN